MLVVVLLGAAVVAALAADHFAGGGGPAPSRAQQLVQKEFALDNPRMSWPAGATLGRVSGMASYRSAGGRYSYYVGRVNTTRGEGYCTLLLGPDLRKIGGRCSYQPTNPTLVVSVERDLKTDVAIISGIIPPKVSTVTVRFADGGQAQAAGGRGWYLIVTPTRTTPGREPVAVVAKSAAGRTLASVRLARCFDSHIAGKVCEADSGS